MGELTCKEEEEEEEEGATFELCDGILGGSGERGRGRGVGGLGGDGAAALGSEWGRKGCGVEVFQ